MRDAVFGHVQKYMKVGGGYAKLLEPGHLTSRAIYAVSWERECLDPLELARLRRVEGWPVGQIAAHFGCTESAVKNSLARARLRSRSDLR